MENFQLPSSFISSPAPSLENPALLIVSTLSLQCPPTRSFVLFVGGAGEENGERANSHPQKRHIEALISSRKFRPNFGGGKEAVRSQLSRPCSLLSLFDGCRLCSLLGRIGEDSRN